MTLPPDSPPRHRGGQIGNRNAYKHGFYSRSFKAEAEKILSTGAQGDLKDETALLDLLVRQISSYLLHHDISWAGLCLCLRLISRVIAHQELHLRYPGGIAEDRATLSTAPQEPGRLPFEGT